MKFFKDKMNILILVLIIAILFVSMSLKNKYTAETNTSNITIIGDSRMVGLCSNKWYKDDKGTCIAKSAMGLSWFKNTAIKEVDKLNHNQKENIVLNLGVNDLYNINNYINEYKKLATGSWKDLNIIILSVNPTKDSYDRLNSEIDSFNEKMKNSLNSYENITYCDSSTYLKNNGFTSGDGLHYSAKTSKDIYEQIKKCINSL